MSSDSYLGEPLGEIRFAFRRIRILEYFPGLEELGDPGDRNGFPTMTWTNNEALLEEVDNMTIGCTFMPHPEDGELIDPALGDSSAGVANDAGLAEHTKSLTQNKDPEEQVEDLVERNKDPTKQNENPPSKNQDPTVGKVGPTGEIQSPAQKIRTSLRGRLLNKYKFCGGHDGIRIIIRFRFRPKGTTQIQDTKKNNAYQLSIY